MRNLKKVLTLVLTVAMLLSVMVVGTGAAFSDQDSIKNKEAVDVCTTLNIIAGMEDGSYRPANNVTRAQMCKMICVALNGGKEPTLGTNATPTFSDVRTDPSSSWAESFIESCNSQGIVSGVGGGRFSPSGSVTGTQAARMLLVALGYRADQEGFTGDAWAINVNTIASAKGLYSGIESVDANAALSRDNAAQMIWNALNAYEVEYVSQLTTVNGQLTSELVAQDKVVGSNRDKITMLEDKYEADTAIGTFDANSKMDGSLKDGVMAIDNAKINGETVKDNTYLKFKSDLDLKYIGEEIKVLYRDNKDGVEGVLDEKDTIYGVYITGATTVYNITKGDLQNTSTTGKIKFNDKEYKVADATSDVTEAIVYNYGFNSETVATTGADFTSYKAAFDSLKTDSADTIKFIVKDGKIVKAYVVETQFAQVSSVSSTKVVLSSPISKTLTIEDHDIYSDVQKDDVVAVQRMYSDDTYVVTKADVVSADVTAKKNSTEIRIDGAYKKLAKTTEDASSDPSDGKKPLAGASGFGDYDKVAISDLGETYNFIVYGDYWVAAEKTSASVSDYAIVLAIDSSTSVNRSVKLLKADNTEQIYTVDKANGAVAQDQLVGFKVKNNGSVELTAAGNANAPDLKTVASANATYAEKTKTYNNGTDNFITTADAVAFVQYTKSNSDTEWIAVKADSTKNLAATANTPTYWVVDGSKVSAFALTQAAKPVGTSTDSAYGYVVSIESLKDGDNNYTIVNVWNGKETVALKYDELGSGDLDKVAVGNFIKYKAGSDTSSISDVTNADSSDIKIGAVKVKEYNAAREYMVITSLEKDAAASTEKTVTLILDDPAIVGVNTSKEEQGTSTDVNTYNEVDRDYNAVVIVEKDGSDWLVKAIFVDDNGKLDGFKNATKIDATAMTTGWPAPVTP